MPQFVFHIHGGPTKVVEGLSLAEAKCEAVRFAGQLICDSADRFWDAAGFELMVSDVDGLVLFTLQLIGTEAPAIRGADWTA